MLNPSLQLPTFRSAGNIVFGKNSIMALKGIESSRVAIVVSPSILKNDVILKRVLGNLRHHKYILIEKNWPENFTADDLGDALNKIESLGADTIIAVGGGSVIDACKIIWLLYEHPEYFDDEDMSSKNIKLGGKSRFISIPTTIGSGSEVSSSAIIYNNITQEKEAIVSHEFLSDLVILDPHMIMDLPLELIISTACDALTHSIEGYISKISNPFMDSFAKQSTKIILESGNEIINGLDEHLCDKLQLAAVMGGWVQNHCLTGGSHAIAHQLAQFNISHAKANAILLPSVIEENSKNKSIKQLYNSFAKDIGFTQGVSKMIQVIEDFRAIGNFKLRLSEYHKGIALDSISSGVYNDPSCRTNPVSINDSYIQNIIDKCN